MDRQRRFEFTSGKERPTGGGGIVRQADRRQAGPYEWLFPWMTTSWLPQSRCVEISNSPDSRSSPRYCNLSGAEGVWCIPQSRTTTYLSLAPKNVPTHTFMPMHAHDKDRGEVTGVGGWEGVRGMDAPLKSINQQSINHSLVPQEMHDEMQRTVCTVHAAWRRMPMDRDRESVGERDRRTLVRSVLDSRWIWATAAHCPAHTTAFFAKY